MRGKVLSIGDVPQYPYDRRADFIEPPTCGFRYRFVGWYDGLYYPFVYGNELPALPQYAGKGTPNKREAEEATKTGFHVDWEATTIVRWNYKEGLRVTRCR